LGKACRARLVAGRPEDSSLTCAASCSSGIATREQVDQPRDGRYVTTAGLVLVRQRPGSAKGVMFITVEDETGVANLVVWEKTFETFRRTVLTSSMLRIKGRVQREGEVVHVIAYEIGDLSSMLSSLGERDAPFPLPQGRGDEGHRGGGGSKAPRDIYVPDLHIDTLKTKAHNFR
jgi:error-prone DNA polymerase